MNWDLANRIFIDGNKTVTIMKKFCYISKLGKEKNK